MSSGMLLRSVAAHGLPGQRPSWPAQPLSEDAWRDLLLAVRAHRLSGLLVSALEAEALPATDAQRLAAAEVHDVACCGALHIESTTLEVLDLLEQNGLEARLLKGGGVAHLDYPDPGQRLFSDVDLLVRSADFGAALQVLAEGGFRRGGVEPRPGFDRRFGKGAALEASDGRQVDLHRTFVMGPYGLQIVLADVWADADTFLLAGRPVRTLDPECRFLHACYHAAISDPRPRLVSQRDVAQMLLTGEVDADRVLRLGASWQGEAVVARAITTTWDALEIRQQTKLSTWAAERAVTPVERRNLEVYIDPARNSYSALSVATLGALPRLRDKIALAHALALPRPGFVPDVPRDARPPWRRALAALWRRMRP